MPPAYRQILDSLTTAFPQPVLNGRRDGQVEGQVDAPLAAAIQQALDQVSRLKFDTPVLGGGPRPSDATGETAKDAVMPDDGRCLSEVTAELTSHLSGTFNWGHPNCQPQVTPPASIASIIGTLLSSICNPNLCSEESAGRTTEAEARVAAMTAELVGYDAKRSAGIFTFGSTGAMLYGVKVGLEKALPGTHAKGLREEAVVLASNESHYCALNVAAWLGIGQDNVVRVPTHSDNSMRIEDLENAGCEALKSGRKIAAIIATMGTTDAFGIDDLMAIHSLRERLVADFSLDYQPHIHADAAIGWAWSVFNDYDFDRNELEFSTDTLKALGTANDPIRHLRFADSISVDFHKTGFAPYTSSLVLFRDELELDTISRQRETMPYLYRVGDHHPGTFTLETSRSAAGPLSALANLLVFGKNGFRVLLGHAVDMARVLREELANHPSLAVLNDENVGTVTLIRAYPDSAYPKDVDAIALREREFTDEGCRETLLAVNDFNRRVFEQMHANALAGNGVAISLTECYRSTEYGEPIVGLKSYVLSPFIDADTMQQVARDIGRARAAVERAAADSAGVEQDDAVTLSGTK